MGLFITFEGPDGSGKTTASKGVYDKLLNEGFDVIYTREPGGIEIAEQIRKVILDVNNTNMDYKTEALLYAASRRQHLVEKVLPALADNKIVICDRFIDSSLAYQGYARGLGIDEIFEINMFAIENHMPDKTIFLDIDVNTALDRIKSRIEKDRLDIEGLQFHNKVFEGYQNVIDRFKDRIVKIDARLTPDEVIELCYKEVIKLINV